MKILSPNRVIEGITFQDALMPAMNGSDYYHDIEFTSFQGKRSEHQDAGLIYCLETKYKHFIKNEKFAEKVCSMLQRELSDKLPEVASTSGACVNVSFMMEDGVCGWNLGDGASFLIKLDKKRQVEIEQLTKEIHRPLKGSEEVTRIEKVGGKVSKGRIMKGEKSGLNVSRTIGDNQYNTNTQEGQEIISRKPEVIFYPLTYKEKEQYNLVSCCDGMLEPFIGKDQTEIKTFFNKAIEKCPKTCEQTPRPRELSKILVEEAYKLGSGDNITVTASLFYQTMFVLKIDNIKTSVIFDGHGRDGKKVAQFLEDTFPSILNQAFIEETLEQEQLTKKLLDLVKESNLDIKPLEQKCLPEAILNFSEIFKTLYLRLIPVHLKDNPSDLSHDFLAALPKKYTYTIDLKNKLFTIYHILKNNNFDCHDKLFQFYKVINNQVLFIDKFIEESTKAFNYISLCLWSNNSTLKQPSKKPQVDEPINKGILKI